MAEPRLFKIIDRFWPGPLTVVVPALEEGETVGIRMPDHPVALKFVQECKCTIAAPSANLEGKKPPQTCQEALMDLNGQVEAALDAGPADIGQGSTVVDLTKPSPVILREGIITQDEINEVASKKVILFVCTGNSCRSVMAEYLLKDKVKHRSDIIVKSAGTGVFVQSTASADTISILKNEGLDARLHRSQPISTTMLKQADLIFVMTQVHLQQVLSRVPSVEKRVYLLMEFANIPPSEHYDLDIADPIGRPYEAYKDCFGSIKQAIEKIVQLI